MKRMFTLAKRCAWADSTSDVYVRYHDTEWGVPVHKDGRHFEFLILESAQAGLSWETILSKRQAYRRAFDNFDAAAMAGSAGWAAALGPRAIKPIAKLAKMTRGMVRNPFITNPSSSNRLRMTSYDYC